MSILLPTVDVSSDIVGSTGIVDLTSAGITASLSNYQRKPILDIYNESGFGLRTSFKVSPDTDYIPPRRPKRFYLQPGESQFQYKILFANPSTPVQLLIPVIYLPNEPEPPLPNMGSELNPYNSGGLTTPFFGETSSTNATPPVAIQLGGTVGKQTYMSGWDLTSDKPVGAIVYHVQFTNMAATLDYFVEATTGVTADMQKTYPYPLPAAAISNAIVATVSFASGGGNNSGVYFVIYGYAI